MITRSIKKILLFLILNGLSIYGQGIIKGIAMDSLTADQLKGAEIFLTGTSFKAVSNIDGEFKISGIPSGEYILQASYLGYKEKKYLVNIKSEETQILNIELLPDVIIGDQAKSQAEEINMKIRSNAIKNVIAGKELQDMTDENIPVTLSRLPGVSILYRPLSQLLKMGGSAVDHGNLLGVIPFPPQDNFYIDHDPASRALIRGMDSKYYNITIDGIRVSPTSSQDRRVDLGIIAEKGFRNIEVYKTITSDKDGDATAGVINLVTGKAPSARMIKAEFQGNYNRLDESANQYDFTGSYGERFLSNVLGIRIDANIEKRIMSNEYQNNIHAPLASELSYANVARERNGVNVLLDLTTPDGGSIRFNNILNKTNANNFEYQTDRYFLTPTRTFCNRETEQRIFLSSLEGSNHLFGLNVDWNAAFSESKTDHPFNYNLIFFKAGSYLPPMNPPYYLAYTLDSPSKNYCREKTASIDISKEYKISNEITGELKFGGKYRINTRSYDENLRAEDGILSDNDQYRRMADGSLVKKDFAGTRFDSLLGKPPVYVGLSNFQDDPPGKRTVFETNEIPLINRDALHLWRQLNYSDFYANYGPDINSYDLSEGILAGYVMHNLSFGQLVKFITGVRIESEHNDFAGHYFPNTITNPASLYDSIPQQTNTYHYNKITLLPNFQMILQPTNFLNLRLATYKTLIRPDCIARMPKYFSVSYGNSPSFDYLNLGNPDLKNADVWNYEIQTQFYGSDIGEFSINAFYKDIEGMVQATDGIQLADSNRVESLGINWRNYSNRFPFDNYSEFNLYSYFNSSKPTRIWGFEIEHRANFRYLPGLLKNIILNYNFTFLRSETWTIDVNEIATTTKQYILLDKQQKLSDIPEFLANVNLGYDIKGFSIRISYFYQGEYPVFDSYYSTQIKEDRLSRLDIAVRKQILENISIILNLNNITNSKEEFVYKHTYDTNWQTAQAYRYGMNVDFGIGINL